MESVDREFFVMDKSVETPLGTMYLVELKDYKKLIELIPFLNLQKEQILQFFKNANKYLYELICDMPLIDLIRDVESIVDFKEPFEELFQLVFKDKDVFYKIKDDEEFEYYRSLIRDVNCIKLELPNPNPEIERFNQYKRMLNNSKNPITFESMYTSVWVTLKKEPKDLTVYQFRSLFSRIGVYKSYDASVLFATVSSEVKIESWCKHIDVLKDESENRTTLKEFSEFANEITK